MESTMNSPAIVSRDAWLAARKAHLKNEKALTRLRDLVAAERRTLPWVKVDQNYVFDTPEGKKALAELFGGRSQLIVYHFMWRWDIDSGCPSCSLLADHIDGAEQHLRHHDVTLMAITRAPVEKFAPYVARMGWRFPWASSYANTFNFDYGVSFSERDLASRRIAYNYETIEDEKYIWDELPGISVFYKDEAGAVFHTYSSYARGGDVFLGVYNWLDLTPKGRNENEIMDWVRRHDEYEDAAKPAACCDQTAA
jgi:predicted dithiol-disulfide oxidoreductase (DUF899 family)